MSRPSRTGSLTVILTVCGLAVGCAGDDGAGPSPTSNAPSPSPTASRTTPPVFPSEVRLTDTDEGADVRLALGGTLTVALESNPSTGFAWTATEPTSAQLEQQGEPAYLPPPGTDPPLGAAGTEVFTFTATAAGTGDLTLGYARSFEAGVPPEKTFTVTVEVG